MLNAVFFVSEKNEILLQKELLPFKLQRNHDAFVGLLKKNKDLAPCLALNGAYYQHLHCDKIYLVAVTEDSSASPVIICEYLENLSELLRTFFGSITAQSILSNIGLAYEIICETNDAGFPKFVEASKLKPTLCNAISVPATKALDVFSLLPGNLFGIVEKEKRQVSGEASKKPLLKIPAKSEKVVELYVDLIEKMSVIINTDGSTGICNILGKLSVKSYMDGDASVLLTFPGCLEFNQVVYNPAVRGNQNEIPRSLAVTVSPGNLDVFSYNASELGRDISLPFTAYINIIPTPTEKLLVCDLKLYCGLPVRHPAVNLVGKVPLPHCTLTVSGSSSLANVTFKHEKNSSEYVFKSPLFPGSSNHTVRTQIYVSSWTPALMLEMASMSLQFEVPMLCHSNMRINNLKVEPINSPSNLNVDKWVRYLTFSRAYEFRINDEWFHW